MTAPTGGSAEAAFAALGNRFGPRFSRAEAVRRQHVNTVTWLPGEPPDAVVWPRTTEEVSDVVRFCATHRVPIVPFGAGTSVEGQVNAPMGGLCVSLRDMTRIVAVHPEDADAVVEAGVTRESLNAHLRDTGLFFPVDPGADASIGGMASTRASGTSAVRYGTMRDNVVALTVVLPDGAVALTASRARKSAAGYDMTRLFVGAEGTLGIITEVTLRLHAIPEHVVAGVCAFPNVEAACAAAVETTQAGVPIARIELLDTAQIRACNRYSRLSLPERPHLFVEFHGTERSVDEQVGLFRAAAASQAGSDLVVASAPEDRSKLWKARHESYWAAVAQRPGAHGVSTDICVPVSELPRCIAETRSDMDALGIVGTVQGHIGDGNFHAIPLVDPSDPAELARLDEFLDRLVARAHAAGGTCTGEHGIGQGRRRYMVAEFGPRLVSSMRAIKSALDPLGIMNPGKILPDA